MLVGIVAWMQKGNNTVCRSILLVQDRSTFYEKNLASADPGVIFLCFHCMDKMIQDLWKWAHTEVFGVLVPDINTYVFLFCLFSTCKQYLKTFLKCCLKTSCDLRGGLCKNP